MDSKTRSYDNYEGVFRPMPQLILAEWLAEVLSDQGIERVRARYGHSARWMRNVLEVPESEVREITRGWLLKMYTTARTLCRREGMGDVNQELWEPVLTLTAIRELLTLVEGIHLTTARRNAADRAVACKVGA